MAKGSILSVNFPDPPEGKVAVFKDLSGGLNLWQLDYRMDADQSPEMKNLWWRDGLLTCRDGQEYVSEVPLGRGYTCFEKLFRGHMVAHIGDGLYVAVPSSRMELTRLCGDIPQIRGTFLRYHDALLYKTKGCYKKITWDGSELVAEDVQAYVPVTVINCTPQGSGDLYQPENRLSPQKTVWYTAQRTTHSVVFQVKNYSNSTFAYETADGETVASVEQVYVNTTLLDASEYSLSEDKLTVTILAEIPSGATVTVVYTVGVREYKLPVEQVDSVDEITVDGEAVTEFTADLETGTITFAAAPPVSDPPVNNTVKITYSKENKDAYDAIMDCRYGCAYGGTGGAVLIFAGSGAQPNGYFWNGSHTAMDMGYFPMNYYNLAGDDLESITGFGQQAGSLMIFKEHAVGKCQLSTQTVDERVSLTLDYTPIHSTIGCDLPWTIRLVQNNLVWCNTYTGVCRLGDTTLAQENRVEGICRNILGCDARPGLLQAVHGAQDVCALTDGDRYWVVADGQAFVWDYAISTAAKPSWFYFTNIPAVSFCVADTAAPSDSDGLRYTGARPVYHLDAHGRISRFVRTYRDYGGGIEKVFTFATQDFGQLQRQKHVRKVELVTRSDTDTVVQLAYTTDHAVRKELTPIRVYSYRLLPRNLAFRFLGVRRFGAVSIRVPGCRYVRYFSLRLSNDEPGCDMSIVSARFFADLVIKER